VDELLLYGLTCAASATVLAIAVGIICRFCSRPALRHSLWLLVFVKLLLPPLVVLPLARPAMWEAPEPSPASPVVGDRPADSPVAIAAELPEAVPARADDFAGEVAPVEAAAAPALPPDSLPVAAVPVEPNEPAPVVVPWASITASAWALGSALWFAVAVVQIMRFRAVMNAARPALPEIQATAAALAGRMGLTTFPVVWMTDTPTSPLLWSFTGEARIVLPTALMRRLDALQLQALLVHELAHYRRRDHWIRALEFLVLGVFWWLPTCWVARRQLRDAEEECCDAWVVWALPEAKKSYATALVETLDFLSQSPTALPPIASGAGHLILLRRRLTMIMRGSSPRNLGLLGLTVAGLAAVFLLPIWPRMAEVEAQTADTQAARYRKNVADQDQDLARAKADLEKIARQLKMMQDQMEDLTVIYQKRAAELARAAAQQQEDKARKELAKAREKAADSADPRPQTVPVPTGVKPAAQGASDSRLNAIERKLDLILQELHQLKKGGMPASAAAKTGDPFYYYGIAPVPALPAKSKTPATPGAPPTPTVPPAGFVPVVPATPGVPPAPKVPPGVRVDPLGVVDPNLTAPPAVDPTAAKVGNR
jgi:bla regulator protein blaR1